MSLPNSSSTDSIIDAVRRHWRARPVYTVLQTGFGDAEQFLQLWAALQADADAPQRLHYLAIASQPPTRERLWQVSSRWPQLAEQLARAWSPLLPGCHRLLLQGGRVVLTLIIGDVATALEQLEARVDFFLLHDAQDVQEKVCRRVGRLAAPQAQLMAPAAWSISATAMAQAGFVAETEALARFMPRWKIEAATPPPERRAIIIGAGLAGSAACESLAARGWQVTLIERHPQAAQEASGNLAGVYMPAISRDDNPTARLTRAAFLFAQQVWRRVGILDSRGGMDAAYGSACGVLQVARDAEQAEAFAQAAQHWRYPQDYAQWLSAPEASARLGMATGSGWFFPQGGWLRPGAVCEAMLQACGERLQRRFQQQATALQYADGQWRVEDADGSLIAQAPVAIMANGLQAMHFAQAVSLPLHGIRGQVSHVPASLLPALPFALCGDGYLTGAVAGMVSVGASYDQDSDAALRLDSHAGNLGKLRQLLPGLDLDIDPATLEGRVGFRCVSADRLPLIGALPDLAALSAGGEVQLRDVPRWPHLHGLLAYASRGLIWAPLAAEILACRLEGEPAPLGKDLLALLDPARFALKAHRQRGLATPPT